MITIDQYNEAVETGDNKLIKDFADEGIELIKNLEYKLSCILDNVTGGLISKPYTDKSLIDEAIHRQQIKEIDYAIKDYEENILTWEYMATTNENGHLVEFPQFGRFKPNTKITLYSKEND